MNKNTLQERLSLHKCKICNEIFTKEKDYLLHLSIHKKERDSFDNSVNTVSTFNGSVSASSDNKKYSSGGQVANKIENMSAHQQLSSPPVNGIGHKCTFCNIILPNKKFLYNHQKKHRDMLRKIQMNDSMIAKQSKTCATLFSDKRNNFENSTGPQHRKHNQNEISDDGNLVTPEVMKRISDLISSIRAKSELTNPVKMEPSSNIQSSEVTSSLEVEMGVLSNSSNNVELSCQNSSDSSGHDRHLSSVYNRSSSIDNSESISDISIRQQIYVCTACNRKFTKKNTWSNHKKKHRKNQNKYNEKTASMN